MNKRGCIVLFALFLTACASRYIAPDTDVTVGDLSLRSSVGWTTAGGGREHYWTIEGPRLNSIAILQNIKDGEHVLLLRRGPRKGEGAIFRSSMSESEVAELIAEAMQSVGLVNVETANLRPAPFGNRRGFRFEIAYDTPRGLHYQGMLLASVHQGRLSFLFFDAPSEHYFARDAEHVEAIFASVRTK